MRIPSESRGGADPGYFYPESVVRACAACITFHPVCLYVCDFFFLSLACARASMP